jgi:hypothetical protein
MTPLDGQEREVLESEIRCLETEHSALPTDHALPADTRYRIEPGSQHRGMELKRRIRSLRAVLAAREESPPAREMAWEAWLASWEAEPGDEDAFVAWWESYSRVANQQIALVARDVLDDARRIEREMREDTERAGVDQTDLQRTAAALTRSRRSWSGLETQEIREGEPGA